MQQDLTSGSFGAAATSFGFILPGVNVSDLRTFGVKDEDQTNPKDLLIKDRLLLVSLFIWLGLVMELIGKA